MPERNPYFCIAIVSALASLAVVGTIGIIVLAYIGREPSQALVGITSTAVGALGGALAVSPLSWGGANRAQSHDARRDDLPVGR